MEKVDVSIYKLLGVAPSASSDQIKSAYRVMSKRLHPDVCKHPDAAEAFKTLTEAKELALANVGRYKVVTGRNSIFFG